MKTKSSHRSAFTLIEMLIVIAIIGILAGMVFKIMGMAQRKSDIADTAAMLQQVGHALNEYRAEYGQYPPAKSVAYEYENVNDQTEWLKDNYFVENPDFQNPPLFRYGLVSYLWKRDRPGAIEHTDNVLCVEDTERDIKAKERWLPFLDGVGKPSNRTAEYDATSELNTPFHNRRETIIDTWLREIIYETYPPYQTCRLWSKGPNGDNDSSSSDPAADTGDDIHWDSMSQ